MPNSTSLPDFQNDKIFEVLEGKIASGKVDRIVDKERNFVSHEKNDIKLYHYTMIIMI